MCIKAINLQPISEVIQARRLKFAGHCWRSRDEVIHQTLLWDPKHGKRSRGRPAITYIDVLEKDTGIDRDVLPGAMDDRKQWRIFVDSARVRSI